MQTPMHETALRVFVHLARGFGRAAWKERWDRGQIVGINHDDPYGYRQAEQMGCSVQQSEDPPEGRLMRLFRLATRALLGFDFWHAWSNREGIFNADVVWTHTESQCLAVLLLARFRRSDARRPAIIAQTVWVMDSWESYGAPRRWFYRSLLRQADMLTFLSPSAAAKAQSLFPHQHVEFIKYGIRADQSLAIIDREKHAPIRILSMGTDRHRDWPTLIAAIRNDARYQARAVTGAKIDALLAGASNITKERAKSNTELMALLSWADVIVVPLVENLHASGITVLEEAVLCGIPVIVTDVGGLRSYFDSQEVTYVRANDPQGLRAAIDALMADDETRRKKAACALARMKQGDLNSRSFVARHVELSQQLLHPSQIRKPSETFSAVARS
ncbi:MAG TPA: glycosyltransferase family 4 protein [Terracidiphilus sp.]|nr:glycosyltransferase family 4 protein [Terracidiphilus sp.]